MQVDRVKQKGNPRGCGVFVLHDKSRVNLDSCRLMGINGVGLAAGNPWSMHVISGPVECGVLA